MSSDSVGTSTEQEKSVSNGGLNAEDIVIVIMGVFGFLGGALLYSWHMPPIIVSVFISTGIAAMVFRFLGGLQGAGFNIGTLKLSGSIAALLGCIWFINGELSRQVGLSLNDMFQPLPSEWVAIDKREGVPIALDVLPAGEQIDLPDDLTFLKNNQLQIASLERGRIEVSPEGENHFPLGFLYAADLESHAFFNHLDLGKLIITSRLEAGGAEKVRLGNNGLYLKTNDYKQEHSYYSILDKQCNSLVAERGIEGKGAEILNISGKRFLIGVVEVNHLSETPYAKFIFGELEQRIVSN